MAGVRREVHPGHGLDLAEADVQAPDVDDGCAADHDQILHARTPTRRGIANFAEVDPNSARKDDHPWLWTSGSGGRNVIRHGPLLAAADRSR
jgi:hypothetical protein